MHRFRYACPGAAQVATEQTVVGDKRRSPHHLLFASPISAFLLLAIQDFSH